MNNTQRNTVESLWTVDCGVSIPQFVESVEAQLIRCAETDLRYARKQEHIVAGTQHGNLRISAWPDKRGYAINSAAGLLYSGTKAGAVECLVNAYQVVAE